MSNDVASLLLDMVILILLGMTIFYMTRLTRGLEAFKKHRKEFDSIIANLLASIDQADHSVRILKKVSAEEAGRLELSVVQAKNLVDELKIINEAAESIAGRLEKLAETNRKIVQPSQNAFLSSRKKKRRKREEPSQEKISSPVYETTLKRINKNKEEQKEKPKLQKDLPSFMIKDKSYEQEEGAPRSQAEQELLEALYNTRKSIKGGES